MLRVILKSVNNNLPSYPQTYLELIRKMIMKVTYPFCSVITFLINLIFFTLRFVPLGYRFRLCLPNATLAVRSTDLKERKRPY